MNRIVTIEQTQAILSELAVGTDPSLLHALRAAGISPRMNLKCNNGYARALRQFRDQPLPPRDELASILNQAIREDGSGLNCWGLMQSHIDTLYSIDEFWFESGLRDAAYYIGESLGEQRLWRSWLNSHIRGMGYKCLSWALFIYQPLSCQLLTLDSWHARRLGLDYTTISRDNRTSHALYEAYEDQIIDEVTGKYPGYLPTVGAACEWFNFRGKGPESHAGLNCRTQEGEWS